MGCGPSLTSDVISLARDAVGRGLARCIAVNDAYLVAPFADVLHFCDTAWFEWHSFGIEKGALGLSAVDVADKFARFRGQKSSTELSINKIDDDRVHFFRLCGFRDSNVGLSFDQCKIGFGRSSGFQALNIAVLSGSKTIILLGFDGGPNKDGVTHFHGGHPRKQTDGSWSVVKKNFARAETSLRDSNVRVFNCAIGSKLGFARVDVFSLFNSLF